MLNSRVHIIPSPTKGGVQVQVKDAIVTSHMAFGSQGFGSHGLGTAKEQEHNHAGVII